MINEMEDRYVAFLDVLGFQGLLGDSHLHQVLSAYDKRLDDLLTPLDVQYVVFSDSVILATSGCEEKDMRAIVTACSHLFYGLLTLKPRPIVFRGAISCGPCLSRFSGRGGLIAGTPIVDAYNYELKQSWVGVMLSPSLLRHAPDLYSRVDLQLEGIPGGVDGTRRRQEQSALVARELPFGLCIGKAKVPFQNPDGHYEGLAVVPTYPRDHVDTWSQQTLPVVIDSLRLLQQQAPDPSSQAKYRATLDWIRRVATQIGSLRNVIEREHDDVVQRYRSSNGRREAP